LQLALGTTKDISPLLHFTFYQLVYYHIKQIEMLLDSRDSSGWFTSHS
jgi:hypothetical protein